MPTHAIPRKEYRTSEVQLLVEKSENDIGKVKVPLYYIFTLHALYWGLSHENVIELWLQHRGVNDRSRIVSMGVLG